jgi:hypothetical protein
MIDRPRPQPEFRGSWLAAARAVWIAFFTLATLALVAAAPARWMQLTHLPPLTLAHLNAIGWTVTGYAIYSVTTEVIFTASYLIVGLIIFLRRSHERMALFTSLMLVAFGVGNGTITSLLLSLASYQFGNAAISFFGFAAWASFTQFPYLFPSGRYIPSWTRIPALIWFLICIPWNFMSGSALDPLTWSPAVFGPLIFALWVSWLFSQVYRYRRVSNPVERQQTKWVIYALAAAISVVLVLGSYFFIADADLIYNFFLQAGVPPTMEAFVFLLIYQGAARFSFLLLPLGFAFSILRYRLWDIDLIIRRTLVYAALTALLALVYFGGVTLVGGVLSAISGQQSVIGIVISTLAIAAMFSPLRRRVQDFIDRRFYRRKYDAEKALAGFAASARDEVDAGRLTSTLVGVVEETVQPVYVSIWVKDSKAIRHEREVLSDLPVLQRGKE